MNELREDISNSNNDRMPLLLYCYLSASSFVLQDIKSLQESFAVKSILFNPSPKYLLPVTFLKQFLFLFINIWSASILVCQFAGYHSFVPVVFARIFKKSCLIVVGGTDCVSMPSIKYGNLRRPLHRWFTLKSLKYCNHIISPSKSLIEFDYTYTSDDFPKQGFRYFDNTIKTPVTVIYNGIDNSRFKSYPDNQRRTRSFLTVASVIDTRNYFLKGLDLFIEIAIQFPDCEFTIIGSVAPGFSFKLPPNVTLIDHIQHELLAAKMTEYTFYCQLSMSEGFGVALAEAMACGCVPIVSKVGIMDFIAGDSGFVLEKKDASLLKSVINKALNANTEYLGNIAIKRVAQMFNNERRKTELLRLINKELNI